jgi:acetyl esterase
LREQMRRECAVGAGEKEDVSSIEMIDVAGVACRLYRPAKTAADVFVWVHGGGWMLGDLECFDSLCRAITNRVPCAVLSVDYRLVPEHVFPAAIDDVWAAVVWAAERFSAVAIGGDSAGGNLAAAAALRARDEGIALAHQLLIYPALDPAVDSAFARSFRTQYRTFRADNDLPMPESDFGAESQEGVRRVWEGYIPEPSQRQLSYASPMNASSLSGVAPATIITAEHDILRGDGEAYAERLRSEEIAVEVLSFLGQLHGFFHLLGTFSAARNAVDASAERLARAFAAVTPAEAG